MRTQGTHFPQTDTCKNLCVNYTGRLGNQLFVYAYARRLLELLPQDCQLIANFQGTENGKAEDGFTDSIRHFQTKPYKTCPDNLVRRYGSLTQKAVYTAYALCMSRPFFSDNRKRFIALNKLIEPAGLYFTGTEDPARTPRHFDHTSLFVSGFFQDSGFFKDIRPILLQEFTPKQPPLRQNRQLYDIAINTNSICVSIRRGDFLSEQYKHDFYLCTPKYFQQAIRHIRTIVEKPVLIFFSDDIEWVRQQLHTDECPCYYESGTDPVWEKLRLMYSCHHFILSNSTFSWWAQYLGRRDDKIVICPSRWYANRQWTSNLIEESFIRIDDF
jgi:hypothetical protein